MKSMLGNKTKLNLAIDILLFLAFLVVYEVKLTGVAIHEWLGVAMAVVVLVHIVLHWKWVVRTSTLFRNAEAKAKLKYVVDIFIFVGFTSLMFTGIMMSKSFLPTFGIQPVRNHFWHQMHSFTVDLTLFLVAFHFALNWKWVNASFRKYILLPFSHQTQVSVQPEQVAYNVPFVQVAKIGSRFLVILLLSCVISLSWYVISPSASLGNNKSEYAMPPQNGAALQEKRARKHEHHAGGFVFFEIAKNLLLFTLVTVAVTAIEKKRRKKKDNQPVLHQASL